MKMLGAVVFFSMQRKRKCPKKSKLGEKGAKSSNEHRDEEDELNIGKEGGGQTKATPPLPPSLHESMVVYGCTRCCLGPRCLQEGGGLGIRGGGGRYLYLVPPEVRLQSKLRAG